MPSCIARRRSASLHWPMPVSGSGVMFGVTMVPINTPIGTIVTPNITPDPDTGIGQWSDADLLRAMHEGIGKRGERLYPACPYAEFTRVADQDVLAIRAYLNTLTPIHSAPPAN